MDGCSSPAQPVTRPTGECQRRHPGRQGPVIAARDRSTVRQPGTARGSSGSERDESGAVLAFVVLLSLALFALAHGALVTARSEYLTARAVASLAARDALADGGVLLAVTSGHGAWMDSVPVGSARSLSDSSWATAALETRWRRLAPEGWLVEATARDVRGLSSTAERAVWSLDPGVRAGSVEATVSVDSAASVTITGVVEPTRGRSVTTIRDADLGLLRFPMLLATVRPAPAVVTPSPRVAGTDCDESDPSNWGDPERPMAPCAGYVALVGRSGPVVMSGGVGNVILVVDGDVELRAGARLYGLVVLTGMLRVRDGARFAGLAVALGGLEVGPTGTVASSPARVEDALRARRTELSRPIPLHSSRRLRPG